MSETNEVVVVSQTDEAVAQAVTALVETMGQGKDFVLEQAPEVIQQFLMWKLVDGVMAVVFGAAMFVAALLLCRPVARAWDKLDNAPLAVGGAFAILMGTIFGPVLFMTGLSQAMKVWIAPKVYLLEYAASLVK